MASRNIHSAVAGPIAKQLVPAAADPPASTSMVLQRERLHALLDARLPGAVWLHGPTGAGKTLLLRSWLHRVRSPSIWLTVDERHRDPAALFAAITVLAASVCDVRLPAFSPEHRDAPAAFARDYFLRLRDALPDTHALVIDDVHHLIGSTATLFAAAIDAFGGRRTLCFSSQLMPDAAFAPHLAGSRLWVIGHRLLAFDLAEARDLATRFGTPTPSLDALVSATDGWAAGLMLAMQLGASGGSDGGSGDPLEAVRAPLALLIAAQVLGGVSTDDLARLRLLAELPQVPMDLADLAPDWAAACGRLQQLSERGLFVERLVADRKAVASDDAVPKVMRISKGCWRLHDLFRSALREPGAIGTPDPVFGRQLTEHLLATEHLELAWQLAARLDAGLLAVVIGSHGSAGLRDAHLLAMLQVSQPLADRSTPEIAVWQARGLIGSDNEAALGACDEAFVGFDARGDAQGAALSIALALFVVFATIENVGEMAVWVERYKRVARSSIDQVDNEEEQAIRVAGEVVHDLLIGGRAEDVKPESGMQDQLMAHVSSQVLSANETILAGSLLVAAMRRANRVQEVELAILRVEALASYGRSAPHIRANWSIENGFHFSRFGPSTKARSCFDEALRVADENALLQPRIGALVGLIRFELGFGEVVRAQQLIGMLEAIGQDRLGRMRGWVIHLRARIEALSGHHGPALALIDRAEQFVFEAGFPRSAKVILDLDRIQLLYGNGAIGESLDLAGQVIETGSEADGRRVEMSRGFLEAHSVRNDDRARAMSLLRQNLTAARTLNMTSFVSLLPDVASWIAAEGLRAHVEVEFLTRVIGLRNLLAPRDAPGNWPWPMRVEVLRPFRIYKSNEPMAFAGKAQQKPLELLKYLACNRDMVTDSSMVAVALWPDAEDAAARKSLEVTISRLRKLLDDDSLLVVKEGKVSLDRRRVSSDAREFIELTLEAEGVGAGRHQRAQVIEVGERLLGLFGNPPLEHEEPSAWREGVRERFRAAFVRAARALIAYWSEAGDGARAVALIEAAIAREPLAENLYRMLIQIHLDAGNHTEAMRVYRQCRQMLSVLIGAQPSIETERLKSLIKL
ncbi:MAG: BTAD domain-containing putative transcriptional regulator [Burkholderiaceae bacterium]